MCEYYCPKCDNKLRLIEGRLFHRDTCKKSVLMKEWSGVIQLMDCTGKILARGTGFKKHPEERDENGKQGNN